MLTRRRRPKVWTAFDVIEQAGYPVERHRGIRTDDYYRMEMIRIHRKGEAPPKPHVPVPRRYRCTVSDLLQRFVWSALRAPVHTARRARQR